MGVGFSTPALLDGTLYVLDNSANLHALDAANGEERWEQSLGTVGKSSPVLADGKLFATEVNGRFHILKADAAGAQSLDVEELALPTGRYAEIYGSPAVAYGRVYFVTEEGIYCLGDPEKTFQAQPSPPRDLREDPAPATATPALLRMMPAETQIDTSETASFRVELFDSKGRSLGSSPVEWSLEGLRGTLKGDAFTPDAEAGSQAGYIVASTGELQAKSRVRVVAPLPIDERFESTEVGSRPGYFLAYVGRFAVEDMDGNKVLSKGPSPRKIHRHITFLGSHEDSGYTIEADLRGSRDGRKLADVGLINSGYTLDLMGNHQRLEIRSWASALRMVEKMDFKWQPDVWYRMKLRVDTDDDRALIRGKVWPKTEPEPADWQITAEDPLPIRQGSPGLYGYSPTPVYFDNVKVTSNKP